MADAVSGGNASSGSYSSAQAIRSVILGTPALFEDVGSDGHQVGDIRGVRALAGLFAVEAGRVGEGVGESLVNHVPPRELAVQSHDDALA